MKITAVELSDDEIQDIMDRAPVACSYWMELVEYKIDWGIDETSLVFRHFGETEVLTADKIKTGVCLALLDSRNVASQVAQNPENLGFVDIEAVDLIVQFGLFGKIVYG